jgi:type III secretory pathway component EscU
MPVERFAGAPVLKGVRRNIEKELSAYVLGVALGALVTRDPNPIAIAVSFG